MGYFNVSISYKILLCIEIFGINFKIFWILFGRMRYIVFLIKDLNVKCKLKILEENVEKYL